MGQREKDPRIQHLYDQGIKPFSISKLNAIDGCLLEAYFTYKDGDRGKPNIYGVMGSRIHDCLEQIYNDEADKFSLLPALQQELGDAEMFGVDFPKDFKGGTLIRDNWVKDMTHFCNTFEKMSGDFKTEELVFLKISDTRYLIGYIDLIQIIDDATKTIDIYDFKTSSLFKAEDLVHHGRQLIVYAMAKEQEGYKVRNLAWIMLKYVEVSYLGYARKGAKSKKEITKIIARNKIGKELSPVVENMLYEHGHDDISAEFIVKEFAESGDMDTLPIDIKEDISVKQYIQFYEYTEDKIKEVTDYINDKADKFEALWDKPMEDWEPTEITAKSSFYCNNLCSHRFRCEYIKKFNALLELNKTNEEDLF